MKHILVYGDSLSWGIIPNTRQRLAFSKRWPGIVENELIARGRHIRVIEDCLNGRRTALEDPIKPGRSGLSGLAQRIEANSPLDLFILMLGTNDFQSMHKLDAVQSAQGISAIIAAVRHAPVEPGMHVPRIMVIAPPVITDPKGTMAGKFEGGVQRSLGLSAEYEKVAFNNGCIFFDAAAVVETSPIDGVHLDVDQHLRLGQALASPIEAALFGDDGHESHLRARWFVLS